MEEEQGGLRVIWGKQGRVGVGVVGLGLPVILPKICMGKVWNRPPDSNSGLCKDWNQPQFLHCRIGIELGHGWAISH